jgi:hypothetical protein
MMRTLTAVICLGVLAIIFVCSAKETQSLSAQECLSIIAPNAFHSKEGLLQILYVGYRSGRLRSFRFEQPAIKAVAKEIRTLFPLEHCTGISMQNDTLCFAFPKQQSHTIPGTFGQASLVMSENVAFSLSLDTVDRNKLLFKIVEGAVDIQFSFTARLFGYKQLKGNDLFYSVDENKRTSILGLNCRREIPRSAMSVFRQGKVTTIRVHNKELKDNNTIIFAPNRMEFLGITLEVLGNDCIRLGTTIVQNVKLRKELLDMIENVRCEPDTTKIFLNGIESLQSAIYELEARRISLTKGYKRRGSDL